MGLFSWLFAGKKNKENCNVYENKQVIFEKEKIVQEKRKVNTNQQKKNYKNVGKIWSQKDDELLKHLYVDEGYSLSSLAKHFGRNMPGIVARLTKLGLMGNGGINFESYDEKLNELKLNDEHPEISQFREKKKQGEIKKDYGFNESGIHKITGTQWDENGFDVNGINIDTGTVYSIYHFDRDGLNEYTGAKFDEDGYDVDGYDIDGFDRSGDKKPVGDLTQGNIVESQNFYEKELFDNGGVVGINRNNQSMSQSDSINKNIINEIKNELDSDIYSTKYVESILSKYGAGFNKYNEIVLSLGYLIKKGYIIKKEYKNFNRYLASKIKSDAIIHIDKDIVDANYNFVADFCRSYELFKVNDELYISWIKMDEIGVNSSYIKSFLKNVKSEFFDWTYFSIKNIKNNVDIGLFRQLGFEDTFIENIIFYSNDIETLRINNHKLFSYQLKDLTIVGFIEDILLKYRSLSIYDFADLVNDKYGLDLDYDIVKYYIYGIVKNYKNGLSDIYYDSTLEKLYIDKEDFYNELSEDDES